MLRALLIAAALLAACSAFAACSAPHGDPPAELGPVPTPEVRGLVNVQRTLSLLARSTPTHRQPVRVLFYGQSITQSGWSLKLERTLRERYPNADLQVENRAIGGFSSNLLVKAAETDLYPYYPDLVIFHVYGPEEPYEAIVRRLRERTTAEILLQNDHPTLPRELEEETDPEELSPSGRHHIAFMNYAFLPQLAQKHATALCDQRSAFKQYLRARRLAPASLLADEVHLSPAGDALMAALVTRCLRYAPELGPSPAEATVATHDVGATGVRWRDGKLTLAFHGNRIDAIANAPGRASVRIDGKPPSSIPTLYTFTRARANGAIWPALFDLSAEAPLLAESWTVHVTRARSAPGQYDFELFGSKTGPDGRGRTGQRFVSKSRRVVIDPDDWNIDYAFALAGYAKAPLQFTISFGVEAHLSDTVIGDASDPTREHLITLAQGLSNGPHTLELSSEDGATPVTALRVYRPGASAAPAPALGPLGAHL